MKPIHILTIAALIVLMLATALILSAFHQPIIPVTGVDPLSVQSKITPFQVDTDLSEVGSTTGILIMGFVIVLIVSVPLLLRKKKH